MPIPSHMVAWFSELVATLYRCDDQRSLCEALMRSLAKQFRRVGDAANVCCTLGLGHEVADLFGPKAIAKPSIKCHLSSRDQIIIGQARRHAEARLAHLRAPSTPRDRLTFKVSLSPQDLPHKIPANVRRLLWFYFPRERRTIAAGRLPDEIRRWVRLSSAHPRKHSTLGSPASLRVEGPRGVLAFQLTPISSADVRLNINEQRRKPDVFALQALGFTRRHCEVCYWLMAGKRDREIATILGCSGWTIAGYVATLLRRTGASNRQAAVHFLGEWLRNRGRLS